MSQDYGYTAANTIEKANEILDGKQDVCLRDYDFEVLEDWLIMHDRKERAALVKQAFCLKLQLELEKPWAMASASLIFLATKGLKVND